MDRNLGAVSAKPGDVGSLGLMYQWGRKDPFMGAASISEKVQAVSTGNWSVDSESVPQEELHQYLTENPTAFFTGEYHLPEDSWGAAKTMNDPCPAGWKIPVGKEEGVWAKASGSKDRWFDMTYDKTNEGINFSGKFGNDSMIWYPASGSLSSSTGILCDVGINGLYWSASADSYNAYEFQFSTTGYVGLDRYCRYHHGGAVRCIKE